MCIRSPTGMLPQFNLHTISGVGVPTASQMMVKDPPSSTSILATGGKLMDGGAKNINHFIMVIKT